MAHLAHSKTTLDQGQAVRDTLRSILDSPHFSKSKRYPAFLEYVVISTLEGNDAALKESVLAAEVFSRSLDYDSGSDSVVRVAAGEVRKRLAQYYNEHPEAPVRIELPIGSYSPEFRFSPHDSNGSFHESPQISFEAVPSPATPVATYAEAAEIHNSDPKYIQIASLTAALLLIAGIAFWSQHKPNPARDFWETLVPNGQEALILPGKVANYSAKFGSLPQQLQDKASFYAGSAVPLENAIIAARVCGLFSENHHDCDIDEASNKRLEDLTGKVLVLVGGFNNVWTVKLLAPLPYRLEPNLNGTRAIMEHKPDGDTPKWMAQVDASGSQAAVIDYIVLARFRSDITNNTVLVIAGLDRASTISGGEYLLSPGNIAQLFSLAPKGWKGTNFEAVLQTDVVSGSPGHPTVVATKFW